MKSTLLRQERNRRGLTQEQLAGLSTVSLRTLQRAENGQPVRLDTIQRLCEYFGKTPEQLGLLYIDEKSTRDDQDEDDMNRRKALQVVGNIGAILLTAPPLPDLLHIGLLLHEEEILAVCAAYIPICWRLYFDGYLSEVQSLLPICISHLVVLIRQTSVKSPKTAAVLASQAHQLACMLALQSLDYGSAFMQADEARRCALIAESSDLQIASLIRKALIYRYLKLPAQMLETYEDANYQSHGASSLLRGRVHLGLAEAYSKLGQEASAFKSLEIAYTLFPDHPEDDPSFAYTHFKLARHFELLLYTNLHQPIKALDALAVIDKSIPSSIVPDRVELSIDQAKTFLQLGEVKQCCQYTAFAATSAKMLVSRLRYNQAHDLYKDIQAMWPHEKHVTSLAEHFRPG